jgi:cysteine desulfurase
VSRYWNKKLNRFHLDANAGLSVHPEVLETFVSVERDTRGNPAAIHRSGRHAQAVLENARGEVAALLGCAAREIVFTSGATESNNLAILGLARAMAQFHGEKPILVASRAEHPAALAPLKLLQQEGYVLELFAIDRHAAVNADAMATFLLQHPHTVCVLQWANNETGVIQTLAPIARATSFEHAWHVDAAQGFGKLVPDPSIMNASTMALSGHKFGAPKGVGVLRIAEGAMVSPLQVGGGQQYNHRSGTESPALAASFAHALRLSLAAQAAFAERSRECCQRLMKHLVEANIPHYSNHPGEASKSLPNTLNISFPNLDGRFLIPALDAEGIEASAGSACSSGAAQASPVLLAAGLNENTAMATCRFSFGPDFDHNQLDSLGQRLSKLLLRLYEVAVL